MFDKYTAGKMRDIFRKDTNSWPEDFCSYVNGIIGDSLLDGWLENHSDGEYREEVRQIIEDLTYGYTDENDNLLLDFDERIENNGQMRLF